LSFLEGFDQAGGAASDVALPARAREHLSPYSQGQNLGLPVLHVPSSLDNGQQKTTAFHKSGSAYSAKIQSIATEFPARPLSNFLEGFDQAGGAASDVALSTRYAFGIEPTSCDGGGGALYTCTADCTTTWGFDQAGVGCYLYRVRCRV
jgi:hypothetical protein